MLPSLPSTAAASAAIRLDRDGFGETAPIPYADAIMIALQFRAISFHEAMTDGKPVAVHGIRRGDTLFYDMRRDPRANVMTKSHSLHFVLLRTLLDMVAETRLVEEVRAKGGLPVWRRDEENVPSALRITRAGLKAIAAEEDEEQAAQVDKAQVPAGPPRGPRLAVSRKVENPADKPKKIDEVIALLGRPSGATADELIAATSWLPHITRAALSGLRKAGHLITRERDDRGVSRYRVSSRSPAAKG
jgi:hypothetical protein